MMCFDFALCIFICIIIWFIAKMRARKARPTCIVWGCPSAVANVHITYEALGQSYAEALCKDCFQKRMHNLSKGIGFVDRMSLRITRLG